jgi:hypothetical protein
MLFYLFIFAVIDCNMWHIVGFRKIISFKIGIKKYTKLFEKTKLLTSDLELLKKKNLCCAYSVFKVIFCSTLSAFENFLLCERILINVTTCQNQTSSYNFRDFKRFGWSL